jgi:muramoyltetrapeptide carboxypeptidase
MRILSQVEASLSPAPSEQFFLGFSDLTALFPLLVRKGYRAIHGPVLSQVSALYARGNGGFEALMASLRAGFAGPLSFLTESATGTTSRSGTLWGGNLSLLTSTLGTRFSPDYAGSIVFVEEVSESAYRVDRMLTQMELAGVWSQAQALLVGDLGVRGSERKQVTRRLQMIQDRWGLPVLQGLPIGHFKRNACLELGREVTVAVESVSDSIDARHRVCLSWTPPRGCPP